MVKILVFFVNSHGLSLTPFYDIVNVRLYPQFEQSMAMALSDEFESDNINAYELASFADDCNLTRQFVSSRLQKIIDNLSGALVGLNEVDTNDNDEQDFLKRYQDVVKAQCARLQEQVPLINSIDPTS